MAYEQGECKRCKRILILYSRGLCKSCYTYIRIAIKTGKTSWAEMMDKGWAGGRANQGRPPTQPTLDAMLQVSTEDPLVIMQNLLKNELTDEQKQELQEKANEELNG